MFTKNKQNPRTQGSHKNPEPKRKLITKDKGNRTLEVPTIYASAPQCTYRQNLEGFKNDENTYLHRCREILREGTESPKTLSRVARAIEEWNEVQGWED